MFRWLSRKGGVQAGYTRVIDLRHPKILGSNRASMNSPFFFLSLFSVIIVITVPTAYRGNRSRRCVASHRRDPFDRALGSLSLRSASVSNLEIPRISNFQRGYARVKTVRPNEWPWSRPCTQRPRFLTLDWHGWIGLNEASSRRLLSRMRNVTRARNRTISSRVIAFALRVPLRRLLSPSFGRTLSAHQAASVCFRNATPQRTRARRYLGKRSPRRAGYREFLLLIVILVIFYFSVIKKSFH